jgi:hypothetical protein
MIICGEEYHVVATPTSSDLTIAIGVSQLLCKMKKKDAVIAAIEGPSSSFSSSSYHHLPLSLSISLSLKPSNRNSRDPRDVYISLRFLFPSQQPHLRTRIENPNLQTDRRKKEDAADAKLSSSALYQECGNPRGILLSQSRVCFVSEMCKP